MGTVAAIVASKANVSGTEYISLSLIRWGFLLSDVSSCRSHGLYARLEPRGSAGFLFG